MLYVVQLCMVVPAKLGVYIIYISDFMTGHLCENAICVGHYRPIIMPLP